MTQFNRESQIFEVSYPDDMIALKVDRCGYMLSSQNFNLPLVINMRAKSDGKALIELGCAQITIQLSTEPTWTKIHVVDDSNGEVIFHHKCHVYPIDTFANIECLLSREGIAVRVNGEFWLYSTDYKYVREFESNPDYGRTGSVFFGTSNGSMVTVESLRVTEL